MKRLGMICAVSLLLASAAFAAAPKTELPNKLISAEEEKSLQEKYKSYRNVDPEYRHAGQAALDRWMDWKWGLRIHWGLYCMVNGKESWIITDHIDDKKWQQMYYTLYQQFNPTKFNPDEWMEIMQRAGMKFFSFTTKHHEGFCMWPTETTQRGFRRLPDGTYEEVVNHFSIMDTPYKKDIVGPLVKSAHEHGMGISLYYSHIDWHDWDFAWDERNFWYDPNFNKQTQPDRWAAFIKKERQQLTEILSYGPIDMVSLDMHWPKEAQEDAYDLARMIRKMQPNILLRNRGIGDYGDYETPENKIPKDPNDITRPWKVIYRDGTAFSYKENDTYKPKEWVLESLIDIVSKGGNFEVGFGPKPDGSWPQEMIDRVSYVGDWLKINGESIFATRAFVRYKEGDNIRFTRSKDKKFVYILSLNWPGKTLTSKLIKAREGSKIRMIGADQDLKWTQDANGLTIEIPDSIAQNKPCPQAYAFKVELAGWPTEDELKTFDAQQPPEKEEPVKKKSSKKGKKK